MLYYSFCTGTPTGVPTGNTIKYISLFPHGAYFLAVRDYSWSRSLTVMNHNELYGIVRLPVFIISAWHWQYFALTLRKAATNRKDQNGKERSTYLHLSFPFNFFFSLQRRVSNAWILTKYSYIRYSIIRYNRITTNVHYDIHCVENVSYITYYIELNHSTSIFKLVA